MQVGFVSSVSKIVNPMAKTVSFSRLSDIPNDMFVRTTTPTAEAQNPKDVALKTALEYCRQTVMQEKPVEGQMAFGPNGNILYQNTVDEKSCTLEVYKLVWGTTAVHSHPKSCTLSDVDAMVLITHSNLSEVVSVDSKGRHCSLKKPEGYFKCFRPDEKQYYYFLLNKTMLQTWNDALPKIDNPKEFCMAENERRLMSAYGFDDVEQMYKEFGCTRTGDPDTDMGNISWRFYMPEVTSKNIKPIDLSDPEFSARAIQVEQLEGTEQAIEIGKKINQAYANILGLEYSYSDTI